MLANATAVHASDERRVSKGRRCGCRWRVRRHLEWAVTNPELIEHTSPPLMLTLVLERQKKEVEQWKLDEEYGGARRRADQDTCALHD